MFRKLMCARGFLGAAMSVALVSTATAADAQVRPGVAAPAVAVAPAQQALEQPGTTRIDLAVESFATSATGARAAGDLTVRRVVAALSGSGIAVREIRTEASFLVPEYEPAGVVPVTTIRNDRRLLGYRSVTGITVLADDARHIGLLVDLAHGAGANRIVGVRVADAAPLLGN